MENVTSNGWIDKPLDGFFAHIYSNGHSVLNLFETDEDYVFGMNLLPVAAYTCGVKLLMIQLMGTHFHIIAAGSPEDCARMCTFINKVLMRRLAGTNRKEYAPDGLVISIDGIESQTELKNKIIYVYRNSIVAGYSKAPWHYRWGPGDILFVDHSLEASRGNSVGELSARVCKKLFHTHIAIPGTWRYDNGMILPHSYLDWKYVENLFGNVRSFLAFLYQKKDIEAQIDRECSASMENRITEQVLRKESRELCYAMFGRKSIGKSNMEERLSIAQKLWTDRRTYSISQLARVTLVDKELLSQIFGHNG